MMRIVGILGLLVFSLQASEASIMQSDFVARSINFVIFFGILWYFAADKIKAIFTSRSTEIQKRFSTLQDKFSALKQEKAQAIQAFEESKQKALEIEALAKKEAYLIVQKVEEKLAQDLQNLNTSYMQTLELKEKEMILNEVDLLLAQMQNEVQIQNPLQVCSNFLNQGDKR